MSESKLFNFSTFPKHVSHQNQKQRKIKFRLIFETMKLTRNPVQFRKFSSKKKGSASPAQVVHHPNDPLPGHVLGDQDQGDEGHAGRR